MPGERRSTGERSEGDLGVAPMDRFVAVPRVIPPASDAASKQGRVLGAAITLWETLRLALDSLRAHKLRSFLTLFGVIMAVTTLVVVMSAIAGLNLYVANRVANLGANVFIIDRFGIITSMDEFQKAQKRPLITFEDYLRLRDTMQTAKAVAAIDDRDRKSTRLNSSHGYISYAVFCLKKKKHKSR